LHLSPHSFPTRRSSDLDLVREYIDAFREEGLKVGIYFSLLDGYHPDFLVDGYHPERNNKEYIESHPRGNTDDTSQGVRNIFRPRSEEQTSERQSRFELV